MKCKNCGGQYKTRELRCPYCETENLLGKLWSVQRSEAELSYERERKAMGKFLISPYMLNRIMNRCLVTLVVLFVAYWVGAFLFFWISEQVEELSFKWNRDKIEAQMEEYYVAGEYDRLDAYMYEKDVDCTQYYAYTQATLLHNDYSRYMEYRLFYASLSEEEKAKDTYYLDYALDYSARVYTLDCGIYSELDERNRELYETYQKEIMAYWVGEVELSQEEIDYMKEWGYYQ